VPRAVPAMFTGRGGAEAGCGGGTGGGEGKTVFFLGGPGDEPLHRRKKIDWGETRIGGGKRGDQGVPK